MRIDKIKHRNCICARDATHNVALCLFIDRFTPSNSHIQTLYTVLTTMKMQLNFTSRRVEMNEDSRSNEQKCNNMKRPKKTRKKKNTIFSVWINFCLTLFSVMVSLCVCVFEYVFSSLNSSWPLNWMSAIAMNINVNQRFFFAFHLQKVQQNLERSLTYSLIVLHF